MPSSTEEFRVEWTINLDAETPRQAAELAFDLLRETWPGNTAWVFKVTDSQGEDVLIDLMESEDDLLDRFDQAAQDYAFRGAAPPEDYEEITEEYYSAYEALRRALK